MKKYVITEEELKIIYNHCLPLWLQYPTLEAWLEAHEEVKEQEEDEFINLNRS